MKTLNKYLTESLLDDEEELVNNDDILIKQFLKNNYEIDGTYTIKNRVVNVNGSINLKNKKLKYLTNGLFEFGEVTGSFNVGLLLSVNILSLKGSPKKVRSFTVSRSKIKNLIGGPQEAYEYNVYFNDEMENLEGSPAQIEGYFNCFNCDKLINLKGAPEKIGVDFNCSECERLLTLDGGPQYVGGDYNCSGCVRLKDIKGIAKNIKGTLNLEECATLLNSNINIYKELRGTNIGKIKK